MEVIESDEEKCQEEMESSYENVSSAEHERQDLEETESSTEPCQREEECYYDDVEVGSSNRAKPHSKSDNYQQYGMLEQYGNEEFLYAHLDQFDESLNIRYEGVYLKAAENADYSKLKYR